MPLVGCKLQKELIVNKKESELKLRLWGGHDTGHRARDGCGGGGQVLSLVQIDEGMSVIGQD